MKAISCEKCDATLKINLEKGIATCEYCEVAYLLDDAVQSTIVEKWTREMNKLFEVEDYKGAAQIGKKLVEELPTDYRVVWQYVRALTYNFSENKDDMARVIQKTEMMNHVNDMKDRAFKLTPKEEYDEYEKTWTRYTDVINAFYDKYGSDINDEEIKKWEKWLAESD